MIILQDTNDLLQVKLGGAVTTNQLPFIASYVDTTSTSFSPLQSNGTTNGVIPVTVVSSPASSTQRTVKYVSIHNADTVSATVTIELSDNSTTRIICKYTLSAGDRLEYTDTVGWRVLNSSGAIKQTTSVGTDTIPATQVTSDSSNRFVTDTQISNFQSAYNAAVLANGGATTSLTFNTSKYYGSVSSPLSTTSITYSFTNAVAGSKAIVFHNGGSEPTYPIGTYKRFGTYTAGSLNILTFEYLDSNTVLMDIAYSSTVGMQPEITAWINKGGVATGFVLTAMNQFLLDIASMRTRILRMNVMWGETLASMFIPLIVNDDSSATPLGGPLDTNVNFVTGNWTFLGTNGGLSLTQSARYILTPFIPSAQSLYGLDDASYGIYFNMGSTGGNATTALCGAGATLGMSFSTNGGNFVTINGATPTTVSGGISGRIVIASRNNSSNFDWYLNGTKSTVTNTSTTKPNSAFWFGVQNTNITSGVGAIGGYFIGKGLTDAQELLLRGSWTSLHGKLGHTV